MRKREMLPFATTLMELEGSMLSKKADTEILNALTCMQNLKKMSLQKQRVEKWLTRVWGEGIRQNKDKSANKFQLCKMNEF